MLFANNSLIINIKQEHERERGGERGTEREGQRERDRERGTEREREGTLYFSTVKILAQRPTGISAVATVLLITETFTVRYYDRRI